MKIPKLGDYLMWEGELCKVIGESNAWTVHIEKLHPEQCPHCNGELGKHQFSVIVASPLFQQSAEPIQTISNEENTIIV